MTAGTEVDLLRSGELDLTGRLLAASNARLRPLLTAKLASGARIVAHNYPLGGDWEPSVIDNFTDAAGTMRTLYLWIADGRIH